MLGLNSTTKWTVLVLAAAALTGCTEGESHQEAGDFVSDNPYGGDGGGGGDPNGTDPTGGDTDGGGDDEGGDDGGERDIAEADIVHVDGDRLYALSRYGGLTVIDVSTPDALPVLGRFQAHAEPFEMYVEDGQVFVMYQGWGEYTQDAETGAYTWQTTSRLMALDASDPANISVEGDFSVPGSISDSRRVGDILYVVTKEDGWCWECDGSDNATVITSLDVSNEADVTLVDQLRLEDSDGWGGRRSVTATDERLYIAGPDWDLGPDDNSTIEVVDISDPNGVLEAGASMDIAGRIESRWQMDEHDGVLRVISQPGWSGVEPPRVETFSVESAADITPLASLQMQLPRPEQLQSVRFDGPHAYAITFERTDPLFTLDLSDPQAPQQVGELEIPGFVWHMETRGDRVLGIGFDRDHDEGSINASLFDVSDFANPTMIERVHFGGDWAQFAEDQDRIHKSFQVLDDLGLLLIPFSGWIYDEQDDDEWWGCGQYQSGIQLVDWADDTLALRGVAPMRGQARRGLIHDDRLLGFSDSSVDVFDIADRDAPAKTNELALAAHATRVAVGEDILVRLSADWWTNESRLEVVDASDPQSPTALGSVSLDDLIPELPDGPEAAEWGCFHYGYFQSEMFAHGGFVYLVRESSPWDYGEGSTLAIDVIDVTDPSSPAFVETLEVPGQLGWGYGPSLSNDERRIDIVGDTMVLLTQEQHWEEDGPGTSTSAYEIVDLSDPAHPVHAKTIARPEGIAHGGLQVFDGMAVSWHMQPVDGDDEKVRFFLERLDLSSAEDAAAAAPVNVPGAVIAYDDDTHRAIVADFQLEPFGSGDECYSHPGSWYNYEDDTCSLARRPLHLVQLSSDGATLLDTAAIEGDDGALRGAAASDERLFVQLQRGAWHWVEDDSVAGGYEEQPEAEVFVFADWESDALAPEGQLVIPDGHSWISDLSAMGTSLVFRANNGLGEIDAADATAPTTTIHDLWGHYCGDLKVDGATAYCAMGPWGVQAVELQ